MTRRVLSKIQSLQLVDQVFCSPIKTHGPAIFSTLIRHVQGSNVCNQFHCLTLSVITLQLSLSMPKANLTEPRKLLNPEPSLLNRIRVLAIFMFNLDRETWHWKS